MAEHEIGNESGVRRRGRPSVISPDAIVAASLELFARDGITATSIDAIAREVGVTKGALYWHFESKEDLVQGVLDRIRADWRAQVLDQVNAVTDPVEKLRRLFSNYARLLVDTPQICLFLQRAALDPDPGRRQRVRTVYAQTAKYIAGILEGGKRSGAFRTDLDSLATGHAILGALAGAELQCLVNDQLSFAQLVKVVEDSVVGDVRRE